MRRNRFIQFLESLAIPNLSLYLVFGQVVIFGAVMTRTIESAEPCWLIPANVLAGEWWRLVTFILVPPATSMYFIIFAWYMFWLFGSSLEAHWGTARYNLFLLTGWVITVGLSFFVPTGVASNTFIARSVFLAFAWLAPNFEILLFFILPVKVKWLALIIWITYAFALVAGSLADRLAVIAATGNYLIFFAPEMWRSVVARRRRLAYAAANQRETAETSVHRCKVCGKDSETHRNLDFRYCSTCTDDSCYCPEHLRNHTHVTTPRSEPGAS
jgi:membrane associated rhomboid family serine protease